MQNYKKKVIELLNNPILLLDNIDPAIITGINTASKAELGATITFLQKAIKEKQENLRKAQTNFDLGLAALLKDNLPK